LPLETATFLHDLVVSNPAHTDGLSQADSHMRLIKSTLQNTFPNFTDVALQSTQAQIDLATAQAAGTASQVLPLGAAALPSLAFLGDLGTGMFQPAAGQLAMSLLGSQVLLMGGTALLTSLAFAAPAIATTGAYSGGSGQLVPIGSTLIWWDDVLPVEGGYAWANGQIIASANTVCPILLARWGTRFGGNGITTMGVPDMRDAVPIGESTMGATASRALQTLTNTVLGGLIGLANNVLVKANLPPITSSGNNTITVNPSAGTFIPFNNTGWTGVGSAAGGNITPVSNSGASIGNATGLTGSNAINVTSTGTTSTPVNNVQPSTTCNYILRLA
jgi:microcystin-dependent protein